jgi:YfiH family protein
MQGAAASDWLIPDWPAPVGVQAVCTTRRGGVSQPPYDTLNLGDHVGDDPAAVGRNRAALAEALGDVQPVFLQQVHGCGVVRLDARTADGTQADGCVATVAGVACTIMVADCLPLLFTDVEGRMVAAAHAGWRGLAGTEGRGVLETVVDACATALGLPTAQAAGRMLAWLGPCIGPEQFEVGDEVRQAFVTLNAQAASMFRPHAPGKWLADLPGLARLRLQAAGIKSLYGNDGSREWCTVSQPSWFFSHRRDRVSGRFAAAIWRA